MAEHQREPITLIDFTKNKEAHIVVSPYDTFEDVVIQARKIYSDLFKGEWDLVYLNKETKKPEKLDKETELLDLIQCEVDTFYWHHGRRIFRGGGTHKNTEPRTATRTRPSNWNAGRPGYQGGATKTKRKKATGTVQGKEYADIGKRFVAMLIDYFIVMLLMGIVKMGGWTLFIAWLYFALLESSDMQATIGKMLMKLRVADANGNRISFGQATGRFFGKWLSSLFMMLGFIMAFFTEKKQALHDVLANTVVLDDETG